MEVLVYVLAALLWSLAGAWVASAYLRSQWELIWWAEWLLVALCGPFVWLFCLFTACRILWRKIRPKT